MFSSHQNIGVKNPDLNPEKAYFLVRSNLKSLRSLILLVLRTLRKLILLDEAT